MSARDRLDHALVDLAARGDKARCAWPDIGPWFTSDDRDERARAARRCHGCSLIEPCGDAADEAGETFGVWAGKDRTRPKKKEKNQ